MAPKTEAVADAPATEAPKADAPATPAAPKEVKSFVKTLSAPAPSKDTMQFVANKTKEGKWSSYVTTREVGEDGKTAKTTRGGSVPYETLDLAKAGIDKAAKEAVKKGWLERKAGGGGFKPRADAFSLSNLPAPKAAAAK